MDDSRNSTRTYFIILASLCVVHYLFWLWVCFPGVLYGDNAMMLAESFPGAAIGDQHSVMYIRLLRLCHEWFGIGLGYPLVWGLFFWHLGIFFYCGALHTFFKSYWTLLFLVVFSDVPFINFVLPHLQLKDFNMSAVFVAASGLLFWNWVSPGVRRWKMMLAVTLVLFFLAVAFRHNAIFAFLSFAPLVIVIGLTRKWGEAMINGLKGWIRISLLSIGLILGLFACKSLFDKLAGDYENYFVHGCIFSFDLAGISLITDKMEIPDERLMDGITMIELKKVFNPAGWDPLWGGWDSSPRILKGGENKEELGRLRDRWVQALLQHPGAYFKHRKNHFAEFLMGVSRNEYLCICEWSPEVGWAVVNGMTPDPLKSSSIDRIPKDAFRIRGANFLKHLEQFNFALLGKVGDWPFMLYPVYALQSLNGAILISVFLCVLMWRRPHLFDEFQRKIIPFTLVLFLSGWLYFMGYFFVSVSSNWRYTHWSGLAFWIGLFLLIAAFGNARTFRLLFTRSDGK